VDVPLPNFDRDTQQPPLAFGALRRPSQVLVGSGARAPEGVKDILHADEDGDGYSGLALPVSAGGIAKRSDRRTAHELQ